MLFNSYIFILFFLPVTLLLYFVLNHFRQEKPAKVILIIMSCWFYAYFHIGYLAIILLSVFCNYGVARVLLARFQKDVWRKRILCAGILANVAVIFYYKYFNFLLENVNALFPVSYPVRNIIMPLGISFFTLQQISYLVDSYRGETKDYGLTDYCLFVTFFPQLVAGPIVTHDEMMPQFRDPERKKFSQDSFARGLYWFAVGLFKKVLLADTLGGAADWGFLHPDALSAAGTFVLSLLFVFQLYFDFSGYCDMACGIAAMFHLDLPINFNSPYKACSIIDFWKRWHMSLTRFLRKYVYFPLGGSRRGKFRTYVNIMVVFLVSGIWHGANWTYVLWGCMHGAAQVLNRIFAKLWDRVPKVIQWLGTFLFVDMAFMLFRSDSPGDFAVLCRNIFTGKSGGISGEMIKRFDVTEFVFLRDHSGLLRQIVSWFPGIHMWFVLGVCFLVALFGKNCYEREFRPTAAKAAGSVIMLVWSVLSLSGLSTFLYFNF